MFIKITIIYKLHPLAYLCESRIAFHCIVGSQNSTLPVKFRKPLRAFVHKLRVPLREDAVLPINIGSYRNDLINTSIGCSKRKVIFYLITMREIQLVKTA